METKMRKKEAKKVKRPEPVDTYLDRGYLVTTFDDGSVRKTRIST
jgi:hypothetical protein